LQQQKHKERLAQITLMAQITRSYGTKVLEKPNRIIKIFKISKNNVEFRKYDFL
jgi:hypothetical protein